MTSSHFCATLAFFYRTQVTEAQCLNDPPPLGHVGGEVEGHFGGRGIKLFKRHVSMDLWEIGAIGMSDHNKILGCSENFLMLLAGKCSGPDN